MESDVIDRFIKDNIVDEVYTANCDIDGCYDEFDITSVEYRNHKVGYINIVKTVWQKFTLEITAEDMCRIMRSVMKRIPITTKRMADIYLRNL